jgi:hypothetical protein
MASTSRIPVAGINRLPAMAARNPRPHPVGVECINGMPLSKWPMATPVMIKELETLNIYSVEDLANVSDGNVSNFTDGRAIREKAIAWLAAAKDGAAAMRYAAEAQRLRDEMAELRKMIKGDGVDLPPAGGITNTRGIGSAGRQVDLHQSTSRVPKPRKAKRRKSVWSPERRAKQAEILRAALAAKAAAEA